MNILSFGTFEHNFVINIFFALVCALIIGLERELARKPAGIGTHGLVIGASMLFSYISQVANPTDPSRIAAQIVSGVGFLGAGMILKSEAGQGHVSNLTTAASIWYSASIGMAIGFNYPIVALIATIYAVIMARIPKINKE